MVSSQTLSAGSRPCPPRGAGRGRPGGHHRSSTAWACCCAPLRLRHLGHLQRALCLLPGAALLHSWAPGSICSRGPDPVPDDPAQKAGHPLSVQLCGGLFLRQDAGPAPAVDGPAAGEPAPAGALLRPELFPHLLWHRPVQPVQDAIIPTDLFPRELASITGWPYARIKVSFDLICLGTTAVMTLVFLGRLDGLGIGTVLARRHHGQGHRLDRRLVGPLSHLHLHFGPGQVNKTY